VSAVVPRRPRPTTSWITVRGDLATASSARHHRMTFRGSNAVLIVVEMTKPPSRRRSAARQEGARRSVATRHPGGGQGQTAAVRLGQVAAAAGPFDERFKGAFRQGSDRRWQVQV